MTPVVNLKSKKLQSSEETILTKSENSKRIISAQPLVPLLENVKTEDWDFVDEYDPQWPNEYEKLKDKQNSSKEKVRDDRDRERGRDRERERGDRKRNRNRSARSNDSPPVKFSGFGQRITEEDRYSPPAPGSVSNKGGGVAIAPPPSLQEISIANDGDPSSNVTIPYSASSVAAKIMAKFGYKDGQGLGKQEQGMSMALQVEKTSKRGGRIIHERDVFLPPPPAASSANTAAASNPNANMGPPTPPIVAAAAETNDSEPSITEIMKAPSKVVLLRVIKYLFTINEHIIILKLYFLFKNMVGPGDVDEELEPEVKDECNTKYGEVANVLIHESFGTAPEDAVKIFVEFKRIESAIKGKYKIKKHKILPILLKIYFLIAAVVDLNGRFFGGRQVRAGFYNYDKFKSLELH